MKSTLYLLILLLILSSNNCFGQQGTDAGSYLSYIGTQYEEISKDMMSYSSAAAHGKGARKVEKKRSELLAQLKESERNVRKMKPFGKSSELRDSVASYLKICQIVLNEDYGKIVNMEDVAEQSYDDMEAYLLAKDIANQKLDEASDRVGVQYEGFAKQNNIKLVASGSKLEEKIKTAGKVGQYHKVLYLIFFKSYKNEAYFLDGATKGDVNAMEQTNNALAAGVNSDLPKLGSIQAYDGDVSLKTACQQALTYYKKEATTLFPVMVDFYIKKENFEKVKKAYDASRTKTDEQIDGYNKAVNDCNSAIKKFNAASDECNKGRTAMLNKWNETSEKFLDSHTPRYR